ncbi:MAG: GGDEF domain-containing protein [Defluviitaleaceae bacterium]|nr:GGDEF domain-containing protein [Defluviitaleaceae bacterium]MCL2203783.1 GGDEF domain-containing protein [Defluviitaleaceae bacterium]MCL2239252.1 GGDEF domain-containing protein [Defluviitaleaceae bacterium]
MNIMNIITGVGETLLFTTVLYNMCRGIRIGKVSWLIYSLIVFGFSSLAVFGVVSVAHVSREAVVLVQLSVNLLMLTAIIVMSCIHASNRYIGAARGLLTMAIVLIGNHLTIAILALIGFIGWHGFFLEYEIYMMLIFFSVSLIVVFSLSRYLGRVIEKRMRSFEEEEKKVFSKYILGGAAVVWLLLFYFTFISWVIANEAVRGGIFAVITASFFVFLLFAISSFAQVVKNAMQKTQNELKHHEKLLSGLNRAAEALLAADESKRMDVLDDGMNIIGNLLGVGHIQIWLIREMDGQGCFSVVHDWDANAQPWAQDFFILCHENEAFFNTLFSGNGLTGSTAQLPHALMQYCAGYGAVSYAVLPMFTEGERAGFFIVYDFADARIFTSNEMNVLASAGLMFTSVFNHNAQRERAYTDTLTGIFNRRYLMVEAERTLHAEADFALILMDIDYFKTINDTYGHATGDEVLQIFASRVKMVTKEGEIFTRYGGEEFVIALPAVVHENARLIAERIRRHIAATPFSTAQGEIAVTVSCGVASKVSNACALTEIIGRADDALYKAKEAGRNIVQG